MLTVHDVARIAHEMNRHYCIATGDMSQPYWETAPDWQKESAIKGVQLHLETPGLPPEASHNAWMAEKEADGWVWGPVKDPEKKTHPCMCPYNDLPLLQRLKDSIFIGVVDSLRIHVAAASTDGVVEFATKPSVDLGEVDSIVKAIDPDAKPLESVTPLTSPVAPEQVVPAADAVFVNTGATAVTQDEATGS